MAIFDRFKNIISSFGKKTEVTDIKNLVTDNSCEENISGRKKLNISEEDKIRNIALLSNREYDVYLLLLEGYTLKESAKQLSIKYSTVNTHMTGIYRKLGVNSRAELIINYRNIFRNDKLE